MRTLFAEVELVRFAVHQVGDVERGRFIALLAFHGVNLRTLRTLNGTRRQARI